MCYNTAVAKSADGTVSLTGQDAHAWVEVYFDGVGWLPVDVTPGYYYDAIALREMIALPDTVRKTAALDDSFGGEDVSMVPELSDRPQLPQPSEMLRNAGVMLLGLAALVVLGLTLWFLLVRLARAALNGVRKRRYRRAGAAERAKLLEEWIYAALTAQGLDACLGWNAAETDAQIVQRFSQVEPGEYTRAVTLMEKFTYGGITPEPFELRVLQSFLEKIYVADWKLQVFTQHTFDRLSHGRKASA